jgi:hypothetical protein
MKRPKEPKEYFWEETIESEGTIHTRLNVDDDNPFEYSVEVFDDRGQILDYAKITEIKYKKIRNPKYDEAFAGYLKEMEAYKEKCAKTYFKSQETKRNNLITRLQKLEKLRSKMQKEVL